MGVSHEIYEATEQESLQYVIVCESDKRNVTWKNRLKMKEFSYKNS